MASPFSIFRKNQKLMYAVLALMAMISFVFLPIILQNMGGGARQNPVLVKTSKYGSLKASDLQILTQERQRILAVLIDMVQQAGANPSVAQQYVMMMMRMGIAPASEESVVDSWLLARHGEQMGMAISNPAINTFLKNLTQDRVPSTVMQAVLKRHGFSDYSFFNAMRDELAATELKKMFQVSLEGIPPAQRWNYFARVNEMAAVEALPVAVTKFTDGIPEPTEEQLKTFFEENKSRYPRPESPEPGFREPQKIALEYFKAPLDKFTSSEMVTDEEVKQRYEKNKEAYDQVEKKPAEEKPMTEQPAAEKPAEAKPTEEKPAAEKPLQEGDKKAVEEKEKDKESPRDTKEPAETKEPEKAKETPKESKDTSALERPSPFMLTALTQDEPAKSEAKATEQPPMAAKDAEPAKEPAKEPAAAKEAKPAETTPQTPSQEKPAETTPPAAKEEKPAEPKTGLTETLKAQIRQEIAGEKIENIFKGLREQMSEYQREWRKYEAERIRQQRKEQETKEDKAGPAPPERPDFEKLAKQFGLSIGSSELVSEWQARDLEIGFSLVNGQSPVWRYAFSTLARFSPEESMSLTGDRYLFWKTQETKERIPEFAEEGVRKEALRWWRLVKAREVAIEKAKSLADVASKAQKPLKEQTFADWPDSSVIAAGPFSWMTFGHVPSGSAPSAARLSNVEGVDNAGDEFMKTVFSLEPGQIGVAMNAPQTVAYVIQLSDLTPPHEMLWRQFEKENFNKYASVANADQEKMFKAWLQGIRTAANVEWTAEYHRIRGSQPNQQPTPLPEPQDEE
jgi:hypothetical protein